MNIIKTTAWAALALSTSLVNAATFTIEKQETSFSIDGAGGAIEGQQIYLWSTNTSNVNQQWGQISHGDGYYSYKKQDTNLCWDGGDGGAKRQAVTLEICDSTDYNQHWSKIKITNGIETYRIEKRNASGYSIDGNNGAENRQSLYLWTSNSSNVNQQWNFNNIAGSSEGELSISTAFDDGSSHANYPASNAIDDSTAWTSRWAANASGDAVNLTVQLDSTQSVTEVGVAWGQGNSRAHTFEIYARSGTSGTWTKIYDDVSSGSSVAIEIYDVTDIDAQQIRIKTFDNTAGSDWTNITEVKVYGTDGNKVPEGDAEYPSDLMSNFDQWKITLPDGDEIKQLEDVSNEYFYVNDAGNGIVFYAPVRSDNGTTPNSDYIRSELREREEDGSVDIYWTTDGTHVVYSKQAITHLPIVKSHLVATQIHGNKDDGIDDALVLRLEDSHLFLSFNGGKLRDDLTIKTNYALGTVHEIMFEIINGKHYVYYSEGGNLASAYTAGNADQYLVTDGSNDYVMDLDYDETYFKVGNYTQSNPDEEGDYTDDADNYGEVVVYDFWVSHD
ncbi:MAG: polysaccharide lyase family 7 protein [Colwellia sp.]